MTSHNASTDSLGEYLLDRKDLRDWHYDHEGRRSGDHQPHCGFQAPVPGRAWTHCVCFGAAARAVEPLLAEVERLRDELRYLVDAVEGLALKCSNGREPGGCTTCRPCIVWRRLDALADRTETT